VVDEVAETAKKGLTPKYGFWARQFAAEVTPAQTVFDVVAGLVLPVVCLVFDPIVFKSSPAVGGGLLGRYAVAAYLFVGLAMLGLALWLATRRVARLVTGPFFVGAAFALVLGVLLLPLSFLTAVWGIGLLGFVPFLTAVTFLRNGVRAARAALARSHEGTVAAIALVTACLVVGVPAGGQLLAEQAVVRSIDDLVSGDAARERDALERLELLGPYVGWGWQLDRVVRAWHEETDPARKDRLARGYRAVAGWDVEVRWRSLQD